MAIANGTCVSFCNQPKAYFGLPWVRSWDNRCKCHMDEKRIECLTLLVKLIVACTNLPSNSTRKFKSLHILASPGYAPGTIAVNSHRWRGFNACYASQHVTIYLQTFPSNSTRNFKVRYGHFLHILAYPGYAPGTIAVNITWMEIGFNVGQTHSSIYPSIFNRLRDIGWKLKLFPTPLAFNALLGSVPIGIPGKSLVLIKLHRIMGLPGSEDSMTIGWAVSTQYQRMTDRRTDRHTDRWTDVHRPAYIKNVRTMTDAR